MRIPAQLRSRRATILGRTWQLLLTRIRSKKSDAFCDPPDKPNKRIRINEKLRGEELLEKLIHEFTHAAGWHIDETFVERFAIDAAREIMPYIELIAEGDK